MSLIRTLNNPDPAPGPPLPVGSYFYTSSPHASTAATTGIGALRMVPWLITRTLSISRLAAEVTVAGDVGSKFRIAVYADTGAIYPGALLLDAGTINGDAVAMQELTVSLTLTPGLYWIGGVTQVVTTTQPTMRTVNGWAPPVTVPLGPALPAGGAANVGWAAVGITGAAPATFPTGQGGSGAAPRILGKIA